MATLPSPLHECEGDATTYGLIPPSPPVGPSDLTIMHQTMQRAKNAANHLQALCRKADSSFDCE